MGIVSLLRNKILEFHFRHLRYLIHLLDDIFLDPDEKDELQLVLHATSYL